MFMDSFEITQMIFFVAGFARLNNDLKFKEFRKKVNELKSEVLVQLPEDYNNIAVQIRKALPYLLPIKDRRFVGEVVCALRAIYKFERLPKNYIDDKREMLPKDPSKLKKECGKFFPVMDRSELKLVNKRKQKLRKYYFFTKLPELYFILPPKKQELPLAYQELTPSLRRMFPFCSRDGKTLKNT